MSEEKESESVSAVAVAMHVIGQRFFDPPMPPHSRIAFFALAMNDRAVMLDFFAGVVQQETGLTHAEARKAIRVAMETVSKHEAPAFAKQIEALRAKASPIAQVAPQVTL